MIRLEISKSSCGVGLKFQDGNATNSLNSIELRIYHYDIVGYTWNFKMKPLRFWNFKINSLNWIFSSTDEITAALMRARNVVAGKECQSLQVKAAKLLANIDDNDNDEEEPSLEEAWC